MPELALHVVLDQKVPREIGPWLQGMRPHWRITHVAELGLSGRSDADIFAWAQEHGAVVITFDEDFADRRMYPVGSHHGVVRLHVWPTTVEEAQKGLRRLLEDADDSDLAGSLAIVDRHRIRIRRRTT